jgi:flagellar basal-body rod modification protein FlgD
MYTTGATQAAPKQTFDREMFLSLLVAQLRNQDPSSPMDTSEMMSQSSQLASMEQLTAVADTGRESFALQMRMAASGLVGQEVSFLDADGVKQTGTVSGVDFTASVPTVTVGEWTVPLDAVSAVRATSTASTEA